jgi:hypothetical protein
MNTRARARAHASTRTHAHTLRVSVKFRINIGPVLTAIIRIKNCLRQALFATTDILRIREEQK